MYYEVWWLFDVCVNGEMLCKVSWDFYFTTSNDARVDAFGVRVMLDGDCEVFMVWDVIEMIVGDE